MCQSQKYPIMCNNHNGVTMTYSVFFWAHSDFRQQTYSILHYFNLIIDDSKYVNNSKSFQVVHLYYSRYVHYECFKL